MAKGTYKPADSPDDPIYNGGFVISFHQRRTRPDEELSPEERFPDLQNLPVDPAEEFLQELREKFKN